MSSEDFRRLRTGHASCGRLSRVRVWALFTVPIVAVTACISITKNAKSYAIKLVLSDHLKQQRQQRKLTQGELGKLLRSSQSRVAKMEAGDPSVSLDLLVRSLLTLGASREDLARIIAPQDQTTAT